MAPRSMPRSRSTSWISRERTAPPGRGAGSRLIDARLPAWIPATQIGEVAERDNRPFRGQPARKRISRRAGSYRARGTPRRGQQQNPGCSCWSAFHGASLLAGRSSSPRGPKLAQIGDHLHDLKSPTWTAWEFSSNARCVVIKSISSATGSTLEASRLPCRRTPISRLAGRPVGGRTRGVRFGQQVLAQPQEARVDECSVQSRRPASTAGCQLPTLTCPWARSRCRGCLRARKSAAARACRCWLSRAPSSPLALTEKLPAWVLVSRSWPDRGP